MGLPARGGPGLGSVGCGPDKPMHESVDQLVAREADGYKADRFSRQRVFMSMNRNEGSGLPGTAPVPCISRHVIEDLVTNDNAPQMIDTPTPVRSGLRARSGTGSGTQQQHVTERWRVIQTDTTDAAQRLIRFQIETTTAEHELRTERMQIETAEIASRAERMAIARLQLDTERAELEARKAVAEATLASSSQRLHDRSRTTSSTPTSPKSLHSGPGSQWPRLPPRTKPITNRGGHHHASDVRTPRRTTPRGSTPRG